MTTNKKTETNRFPRRFTCSLSEDGSVYLAVEQGEYGKVGYRAASATLVPTETLDGVAYMPRYGDGSDLTRVIIGMGKSAGLIMKAVYKALGEGAHMPADRYDAEREARWEKEKAESEAPAETPAEPDSDHTV